MKRRAVEQRPARQAHTLEVGGSSPPGATIPRVHLEVGDRFRYGRAIMALQRIEADPDFPEVRVLVMRAVSCRCGAYRTPHAMTCSGAYTTPTPEPWA